MRISDGSSDVCSSDLQIDEFERVLRNDLEGEKVVSVADDGQVQKLNVMAMKAKDVRPDHVHLLLKPIWARGAQRQTRKVRSFQIGRASCRERVCQYV